MNRVAEWFELTPGELQTWLAFFAAVVALGIGVLVLARLRWIQTRPLGTCVVLSVIVHVLLLCGIVFSRLLDFPDAPGSAGILVSLEDISQVDWGDPSLTESTAAPEEPVDSHPPPPSEASSTADAAEPTESEETTSTTETTASIPPEMVPANTPLELPELLESIASAPPSFVPANDTVSSIESTPLNESPQGPELTEAQPLPPQVPPPASQPVLPNALDDEEAPADSPELAAVPLESSDGGWQAGGAPDNVSQTNAAGESPIVNRSAEANGSTLPPASTLSGLQHRDPKTREAFARRFGANAESEQAVRDALDWLARNQEPSGLWEAARHGAGRGGIIDGHDRAGCGLKADNGISGLALLAFLASGSTHRDGEYRPQVARGLQALWHDQDSSGSLAGRADPFAAMYCHGIATLALSEAYLMTGDERLVVPLQRALVYAIQTQNPLTGGWRYRPGEDGDTSQFGWQLMAIHSARKGGFGIPPATFERMDHFLTRVTRGSAGGLACYRPDRPVTPTMTAEALVCRLMQGGAGRQTTDEATAYLLAHPPGTGILNCYYNYYGSLALHLSGVPWESWNRAMQKELLPAQRRDATMAGSWNPTSLWGGCGGRVYSTATAALCLEVYYRYLPLVNSDRSAANFPRK